MASKTHRHDIRWTALAVAAVAVLLYLPTLGHGFAYDDLANVQRNPLVVEERFTEIFVSPFHVGPDQTRPTGLYRPLTVATFALGHAVSGLEAAPFHAVNVALHAAVSVLVLLLGLALGLPLPAAAFAGALFAAHPVHVDAVSAIANRGEPLAAVFFLAALLAYARLRDAAGRPAVAGTIAAAGLLALSLLAKENAITFLGVVLAWEMLGPAAAPGAPPSALARLRASAPALLAFAAMVVAYLAVRAVVLGGLLVPPGSVTLVENPVVGQGLVTRWATALAAAGRYARLFVLPVALSPDYSFAETEPVRSALNGDLWLGVLALAGLAAITAWAWRRVPALAFVVLFALATYSVVSNLVFTIGVLMAERLLYLPSVGLCLLAGFAADAALRRGPPRALGAVAAGLLSLLAIRTVAWSAVWKNDLTLFSAAAVSAPRSVKVLGSLAVELASAGRPVEAVPYLERALSIVPDFIPNRLNLAALRLQAGDTAAAEREYRLALASEPGNVLALAGLGLALERRGDLSGAESAYREALRGRPDLIESRLRLAGVLLATERYDDARHELRTVLSAAPALPAALRGMGLAALSEGRYGEAIDWLEKARASSPGDPVIDADLERARSLRDGG